MYIHRGTHQSELSNIAYLFIHIVLSMLNHIRIKCLEVIELHFEYLMLTECSNIEFFSSSNIDQSELSK